MKRILSYLSLAALVVAGASAAPISPESAFNRVQESGQLSITGAGTRSAQMPKLLKTFKAYDGEPALYIFDNNAPVGFLVVSADDATAPLLGYADSGEFDPNNIPPALEYWLGEYQRQIEYARENGATRSADTRDLATLPDWSPVGPLVKTRWDQDEPYNDLCPLDGANRSLTGCVATAMSQVMNYFKYPLKGQGSITYTCKTLQQAQNLTLNFSDITFDWANMRSAYVGNDYTEAQANAVATLMQAAGYSVKMAYSYNLGSGAVSALIPGALVNYFNYDPEVSFVQRGEYTYTQWATMLYNNLKYIGPLIYDGDSPVSGGHSFICDGYQDGYFHFNWGWSGVSDGYFLLDALNPTGIGNGGAAGGFNFNQDAIFGIQPKRAGTVAPKEIIFLQGSVYGYNSNSYFYVGIKGAIQPGLRYFGQSDMTFNVGIIAEPVNNSSAAIIKKECSNNETYTRNYMPLDPGFVILMTGKDQRAFPTFTLNTLGLQDNVKYKVTLAYQPKGTNNWIPVETDLRSSNYFYVTKNGSNYTYENMPQLQFTGNSISFDTQLYYNTPVNVTFSVTNNTGTQLTAGATPVLLDNNGDIAYMGNSYSLSINAGETYTSTDANTFFYYKTTGSGAITSATQFTPALFDIDTETIYYTSPNKVTMQPQPSAPTYSINLVIDNETFIANPGDLNYGGYYEIEDSSDFETTATLKVTNGVFTPSLSLYIFEIIGSDYVAISSYYYPSIVASAGETIEIPLTVSFPDAVVGKNYYMTVVANGRSEVSNWVKFVSLSTNTGVESIATQNDEINFFHLRGEKLLSVAGGENGISNVEAYYINGMKAPIAVDYSDYNASVDLSTLGKGVIIVTATDKGGNRKSIKVAL